MATIAALVFGTGLLAAGELVESVVRVPDDGTLLALRDVDGDGDQDLVRIERQGFALYRMGADGRLPERPDARLPWPGTHLAWDLVDFDGDGAVEVLTFLEGRSVRAFDLGRGDTEGRPVLEGKGYLPRGVGHMRFARDVDGDGRLDLVLPGSGQYAIHLRRDDGFAPPLAVRFEAYVGHQVGDPEDLEASFGQNVSVPWFSLEDVDGDGRLDLVSKTDDRVLFHLADPELADVPTWELDLAALRSELPTSKGFDFDDLLSHVARRVAWQLADLDGKYPRDLVLQVGSTFKVYLGGARTGPTASPDQLLKSSGNALYFFLRDVQGDARPDLQLVRGEGLSLGRVLRWLILPGKLDFELYTYENGGGKRDSGVFSLRPTRRNTLSLKIPRLLTFIDEIEGAEAELEAKFKIPARRADFDGDGRADDVVDIVDQRVAIFRGRAPATEDAQQSIRATDVDGLIESFILRDLDRMDDGGTKTIDVGELSEWNFSPGARLREACADQRPDVVHPLRLVTAEPSIIVKDVNGDGRSDVIVLSQGKDDSYLVQVLVYRE